VKTAVRWLPAALLAAVMVLPTGCGPDIPAGTAASSPAPAGTPTTGPPSSSAFAWFKAGPAPAGWHTTELPDGTAVLAYPPDAAPVEADDGTVAAGVEDADGALLVYVNATPQQGAESPATWTEFRTDHLSDENGSPATLEASTAGLAFQTGTGSCIIDSYVTRIGAHRYREIACLVTGSRASSVIIAAAPAALWERYRSVLEQAVDAYVVR
jgi:hypothetical protein